MSVLDSKLFSLGGGVGGGLDATVSEGKSDKAESFFTPQNVQYLASFLSAIGTAIADPQKTVAGEINNLMMQQIKAAQFQELLGNLLGSGGGLGAGSDEVGTEAAKALGGDKSPGLDSLFNPTPQMGTTTSTNTTTGLKGVLGLGETQSFSDRLFGPLGDKSILDSSKFSLRS